MSNYRGRDDKKDSKNYDKRDDRRDERHSREGNNRNGIYSTVHIEFILVNYLLKTSLCLYIYIYIFISYYVM